MIVALYALFLLQCFLFTFIMILGGVKFTMSKTAAIPPRCWCYKKHKNSKKNDAFSRFLLFLSLRSCYSPSYSGRVIKGALHFVRYSLSPFALDALEVTEFYIIL